MSAVGKRAAKAWEARGKGGGRVHGNRALRTMPCRAAAPLRLVITVSAGPDRALRLPDCSIFVAANASDAALSLSTEVSAALAQYLAGVRRSAGGIADTL